MKKVYRSFSSLIARIFAVAIAFMGYGCDESGKCMYGTPTGNYEIKGSVTTEDGSPVEGATVRVTGENIPSGVYSYSTATSNNEGNYVTSGKDSDGKLKVVCIPSDPTLEPDSTIVPMKYVKTGKNKDPWYVGSDEATVDFNLKKK